ncbi:MAG: cytochrome c [Acidisphaera sp.]|nr:cytochrome c [Acidisphaera sp.]
MARMKVLLAAGLAVSVFGLAQAQVVPPAPPALPKPPYTDPQEAIVARQASYKAQGQMFGAMKKAIDAKQDPAPFAPDAAWMSQWGQLIPSMFPPGSETGHDTKALPAIWSDKAGFDKDAANFNAAAAKLAQVATTNDKAAFAEQYQAVGETCGACHRAYRARTQ